MATSKEGINASAVSETCALVREGKRNLEERFGLLYEKGKTKIFNEEEKTEIEALRKELGDLMTMVNTVQQDLSQVLDIQIRPGHEKGRLKINERDSGFDSKYVPSPRSSTDPLARSNRDSTNRDSTLRKYHEQTESCNQTSSCTGSNNNDNNGSGENRATSLKTESSSSTHNLDANDDKCVSKPEELSNKSDSITKAKTYGDTVKNVSGPDERKSTVFYLGSSTSSSSISSTNGSEVYQYLPSSSTGSYSADDDPSSVSTDVTQTSDRLNDLAKPPSEENNAKQP